jgi:hypothetical protein
VVVLELRDVPHALRPLFRRHLFKLQRLIPRIVAGDDADVAAGTGVLVDLNLLRLRLLEEIKDLSKIVSILSQCSCVIESGGAILRTFTMGLPRPRRRPFFRYFSISSIVSCSIFDSTRNCRIVT